MATNEHESAIKHVSGAAPYVDDTVDVSYYHIAIGGSEIAYGIITSIDLTEVRNSAGVVDVILVDDIPGHVDIGPVFKGDPLLTSSEVEFYGQAIFAVLAKTQFQARQSVKKAKIQYKESSPVLELTDAIANKFYVRPPHRMQRGDAEGALKAAARTPEVNTRSGSMRVGGQEHFYLEGQVATAMPDEDNGVHVVSSNQNPTEAQKLVAEVLGLSMNDVLLETRRLGGGFGGKETQANACCCFAALFALRNNCKTVCRLSRRDDIVLTGKRHEFINDYEVSFAQDGAITAVKYQLAGKCGSSPDLSDAIVDRAMFHCDNAYYYPNVLIDGLRCKTHTVSNTAFRGFGGPQGMIAAETVIDEIAFALKLDPLDVRKRNFYSESGTDLTPYYQVMTDFTVPRMVGVLEASSEYRLRRQATRDFNNANRFLKKGIALTPVKFGISFTATHLNQAGALLHLYTDGTVHLNHGGTEMGQGLFTKVAQIVAAELGVAFESIKISATRTDKVPNTSATAASSGSDLNGMAALLAAREIKKRLTDFLTQEHGCTADQLFFSTDGVSIAGKERLSWQELATAAWVARVSLSATGFYKTPDIYYDRESARGRPFLYYANGAAVSEVLIDTLTGEMKLLRTDIIHDVGSSLNDDIDIGQIEGGFIQGVGWLTTEELKWNADGRLLSDGPATYKIPAIGDVPEEFYVELLADSPNPAPTVMRSKAVGEPPLMLAFSVWCAIRDAIAATGNYSVFPKLNAPATAEEILRCVDEVKASAVT